MAFRAVQLALNNTGTDDIVFSPEALELVAKWPPNTKVIAIGGRAREGKSTLCMLILRSLAYDWFGKPANKNFSQEDFDTMRGFEAKNKEEPVTSGVWILNKPINLPQQMGGGQLIVIDTEGTNLGNDELTALFSAVSCFLSSTFVYILPGIVDNTHVGEMAGLVNRMGGSIHSAIRSELPNLYQNGNIACEFIPKLLVVSSKMTDQWLKEEGFETTTRCKMNSAEVRNKLNKLLLDRLAPQPGLVTNAPGNIIKALFPSPEYAITRAPNHNDFKELQNKFQVSSFSSKFGTSINALVFRMIKSTEPKMLGGKSAMDWKKMPKMLNAFVKGVNATRNDVPSVHDGFEESSAQMLLDCFSKRLQCFDVELPLDKWNAEANHLKNEFMQAMEKHGVPLSIQNKYFSRFDVEQVTPRRLENTLANEVRKRRELEMRVDEMQDKLAKGSIDQQEDMKKRNAELEAENEKLKKYQEKTQREKERADNERQKSQRENPEPWWIHTPALVKTIITAFHMVFPPK